VGCRRPAKRRLHLRRRRRAGSDGRGARLLADAPEGVHGGGGTLTVKLWAAEPGRELDFDRMWAVRPMAMMADLPGVLLDEQRGPFKKVFNEKALRGALAKLQLGTLVNVRMGAAGSREMALLPKEMFRRIYAEFGQKLYFFACDWFPFAGPVAATTQPARPRDLNTARGHAKTHDLLLAFGKDDGAGLAAAWSMPAYALPPASYLCGRARWDSCGPANRGGSGSSTRPCCRRPNQAVDNAARFRIYGMWTTGRRSTGTTSLAPS